MDVESRLLLAKELPPSMATTHVRQRNAGKKDGTTLSTSFGATPIAGGSLVFTIQAAWGGWQHLDRAVAFPRGVTFQR